MSLTKDQIKNRFWNSQKIKEVEPQAITLTEEYAGEKSLSLFITQLTYEKDLTKSQKKKLIKEWLDYLPKLKNVKYLWVKSKIDQEVFESICKMPNLEILKIKYFTGESIDSLVKLKKLEHLSIYMPRVTEIDSLKYLKGLETLCIGYPKSISDFSCVSDLQNLEGLEISGSMYKNQEIQDLKFLEQLTKLKYLTLISTNVKSKSLDPILKLNKLEFFISGFNFPIKEFEKLRSLEKLDNNFIDKAIKYKKGIQT